MPIKGRGWELHVIRTAEQRRGDQARTIGRYQVYRDGVAVPALRGATAEPGGPGDNDTADCGLCIEPGTYALATQEGDAYCSIGYVVDPDHQVLRKPALQLRSTGQRTDILVHPGHGFLASLGCLNPTSELETVETDLCFQDSQERVMALIHDLEDYVGNEFPTRNGQDIPRAYVVVEPYS